MKNSSNNGLRKAARISGTILVVFVLALAVLELIDNWNKKGTGLNNYLVVLFLALGAGVAALVLALWTAFWGGMISLLFFIAFNILAAMNPLPGASYPPFLLLTLIPSCLYLRWWWLEKKAANNTPGS